MKCDTAKLSHRHQGSSSATSPLFRSLHVRDTGKSSLKAPPRNKMALFEQFTVPYNSYLPPNKGACTQSASKHGGANESLHTCSITPATVFNSGASGIGKSSFGSSVISLSNCSAVVNADESPRLQGQQPEDDSCSLLEPKLGTVSRKGWRPTKVSTDTAQDINVAQGVCLSSKFDDTDQGFEQAVGSVSEGFQKWNKGFITGCNVDPGNLRIKEHSNLEINSSFKGLVSPAGSPLFDLKTTECSRMEDIIVSNPALSNAPNQVKSNDQCAGESATNAVEKPVINHEGDVRSVGTMSPASLCDDKIKLLSVPPLPAIIKPKHLMHAIGQQLFWKARKTILRQQEVFASQVFELHKLIEVQKLVAKMPSTLMEEHLLSGMALDRVGGDSDSPPKVSAKKEEISNKGAQQAPTPRRSEGQEYEIRPPQGPSSLHETGQVVGPGSQTKRRHSSDWPQPMTNTPYGEAPRCSRSDGISAWGYPMGSLNRPFFYPPGAGRFPPRSGFGGPYVVGSNLPMAPFTFPCYASRPQQPAPVFGQTNHWPTPMYHNPVFTSMTNDWFAMNYPGQGPLTSGGEKLGPTNSAPSINMKAEASSHSFQPAVVPLSRQPLEGASSCSKLVATKSFGSVATASVSTPQDGLPRGLGYKGDEHYPASKPAGDSRFVAKSWGALGGDTWPSIKVRGSPKDTKEVPLCSREAGINIDGSCGKNALNLFPLQPLNSIAGASEEQVLRQDDGSHGRIIKAIPRSALAASESAAGILRSIQRERQL